ncbi:MAG: SRPBCC family protein, partial [Acidimicrobiales bacterium]
MDSRSTIALGADPDRVFGEVANLDNYPAWLGMVQRAERCDRLADEPGPAWMVDLGARLGPIRRTKRVRMVRAEARPPKLVRFERRETDGGQHSAWVLTAEVESAPTGSRLTLGLYYGG